MNDLDAKLARIAARVAVRADETRAELDRLGWLDAITLCRDTFGARLVHLKTATFDVGNDVASVPYDFNLRGYANASGGPVHDYRDTTAVSQGRSRNEPYRGKANGGKRGARKAGGKGAGGGAGQSWQYSGRDRAAGPD